MCSTTTLINARALGVIERGAWKVADAVAEQPWLPQRSYPEQHGGMVPERQQPGCPQGPGTRSRSAGMSTALVAGGGPNGLAPPHSPCGRRCFGHCP